MHRSIAFGPLASENSLRILFGFLPKTFAVPPFSVFCRLSPCFYRLAPVFIRYAFRSKTRRHLRAPSPEREGIASKDERSP